MYIYNTPKISNKMVNTKIVHTSRIKKQNENMFKNTFNLCSHIVKYTESESDIQSYNFFFKNTQNAKTFSKSWNKNYILEKRNRNNQKHQFVFCNLYKFHN